ncbi:protein of unknown function [Xenorhabdus poinarii G6]|uniref:Uncharacterized protein n=1 Tax=Xenorhabdus poinarii G6 TaxID=1354304 RepID=A0A068R012_9GAMM|nr:protein of unknown function [Xenorhabdus poinarii G6]
MYQRTLSFRLIYKKSRMVVDEMMVWLNNQDDVGGINDYWDSNYPI